MHDERTQRHLHERPFEETLKGAFKAPKETPEALDQTCLDDFKAHACYRSIELGGEDCVAVMQDKPVMIGLAKNGAGTWDIAMKVDIG